MKIQVSTRDMLSKIVENTVFVLLGVCVTPVVNFEVERERERRERCEGDEILEQITVGRIRCAFDWRASRSSSFS